MEKLNRKNKTVFKKTPQSISLGLNVGRYYTATNNIRK